MKNLQKTNQPKDAIEQVEQTKKKPLENSTDINSQSLIKDIGAYFKGLYDGKNLSVEDLLELDEGGIEGLLEWNAIFVIKIFQIKIQPQAKVANIIFATIVVLKISIFKRLNS